MGIFGLGSRDTLYFTGCYSYAFLQDKTTNYERILKKIGVSFDIIERFLCCGGFLEEAGYEKQLRKKSRENKDFFDKKAVKKIITNCALCHKMFSKTYPDMLPDWKIETENILITILNAIKQDPSLVKVEFYEKILYLDSCYLSRYLGIKEEPREILSRLGFEVMEMPNNREECSCEGSCGNLKQTNPELSKKLCLAYLKKVLKYSQKNNIRKIVTADPRVYHSLAKQLEELKISEPELLEFSDVVCDSFKIRRD